MASYRPVQAARLYDQQSKLRWTLGLLLKLASVSTVQFFKLRLCNLRQASQNPFAGSAFQWQEVWWEHGLGKNASNDFLARDWGNAFSRGQILSWQNYLLTDMDTFGATPSRLCDQENLWTSATTNILSKILELDRGTGAQWTVNIGEHIKLIPDLPEVKQNFANNFLIIKMFNDFQIIVEAKNYLTPFSGAKLYFQNDSLQ